MGEGKLYGMWSDSGAVVPEGTHGEAARQKYTVDERVGVTGGGGGGALTYVV